jgi:hypothetical protein
MEVMKRKISLIALVIIICSGLIMIYNRYQNKIGENISISSNKSQGENFIIYDEVEQKNILKLKINLENKSVAEVTQEVLKDKGIDYTILGSGDTVYFSMINGIKERSNGPLSGWCYYVNGTRPSVSSGRYKLKSEDKVEWKYLKDGLKN